MEAWEKTGKGGEGEEWSGACGTIRLQKNIPPEVQRREGAIRFSTPRSGSEMGRTTIYELVLEKSAKSAVLSKKNENSLEGTVKREESDQPTDQRRRRKTDHTGRIQNKERRV